LLLPPDLYVDVLLCRSLWLFGGSEKDVQAKDQDPQSRNLGLRGIEARHHYRAMLCIRGTSHGPVSPCPSVSVTSRSSTKTAKRRFTQTTPHDTPGSLVFWCQRSQRNSTGVTPYKGAECRWGGQNRRLSTNNRLYLENGTT